MKYRILTDQTKIVDGHTLYRIQRISDDALGGWIEKEHNLSQEDDCWVGGEACVYGDARVYGSAGVYDEAQVYGSAEVSDLAQVGGQAQVYDCAQVCDSAEVSDSARIYGDAHVLGFARVFDSALVYGNAVVSGWVVICASAKAYGQVQLRFGEFTSDCRTDHEAVIRCGVAQIPFVDGKIILYKRVKATKNPNVWVSCYDSSFKYYKDRPRIVKNPDLHWEASCASGLHLSHADYWNDGDTLIACEVELKDIICVQAGKVRCRRIAKILGPVKL